MQVRLVRDRGTKLSRGFAFVEFGQMSDARAALASSAGGASAPPGACGTLDVDGAAARISWARDTSRSGRGGAEAAEPAAVEGLHLGPKRAGYGVPPGFEPDQVNGGGGE